MTTAKSTLIEKNFKGNTKKSAAKKPIQKVVAKKQTKTEDSPNL